MTLDDASAVLDCTEAHVLRLVRQGKLVAARVLTGKHGWVWVIDGKSVRARRTMLAKCCSGKPAVSKRVRTKGISRG